MHLVVMEEVHHLGSSLEVMILLTIYIPMSCRPLGKTHCLVWQKLRRYSKQDSSGGSGERSDSDSSLAVSA